MNFRSFLFFVTLLTLSCFGYSYGQSSESQKANVERTESSFIDQFEWIDPQRNNIHEFHFMGGYSFHSTRGFWGKIPDATLRIYSLRYNRKILTFKKQHVIEYLAELNLGVHYELSDTKRFDAASYSGWGFRPLGFQFNYGKDNIVQPFLKSSTGFMFFKERYPNERGTKFNFTLELGGGVEFMVFENLSVTLGYKYHHMSNGGFGNINPGTDSNIFYTGITIF